MRLNESKLTTGVNDNKVAAVEEAVDVKAIVRMLNEKPSIKKGVKNVKCASASMMTRAVRHI